MVRWSVLSVVLVVVLLVGLGPAAASVSVTRAANANHQPLTVYSINAYGADSTGTNDSYVAFVSAQTAAAVTCGMVYVPPGNYKVLSKITVEPCVTYEGDGWQLDANSAIVKGSVIVGDGTDDIFVWNDTALGGQPVDSAAVLALKRSGVKIKHLAFDNVKRAIHFGDLYNTGIMDGELVDLYVSRATEWGIYCENCSLLNIEHIRIDGLSSGAIGAFAMWTSQTSYNHGNNNIRFITVETNRDLARCISILAKDGSRQNDTNIDGVQCNTSNTVYTQATTMTGASANITVTDGTKFPLDIPVTFDASVNGFTANRAYFVVSQVSNVIQVADRMRGTALNSSSNSAVNIKSYGYPGLEIVGHQATSLVQPMQVTGVDVEGKSTCNIVVQLAYVHLDLNYIDGGQGTTNASSLCVRGSLGTVRATQPISMDSDFNSGFYSLGVTLRTGDTNPSVQYAPLGFYRDKGSRDFSSVSSMLQQYAATVTDAADTNENIARSVTLYGRQLGANGCVRWSFMGTVNNNANVKTFRVRLGGIGGTIYYSRNVASDTGLSVSGWICNKNSNSSQGGAVTAGTTHGGTVLAWGNTTSAVDTTADTTLVVTYQKATAGDAMTVEDFHVEAFPGQ